MATRNSEEYKTEFYEMADSTNEGTIPDRPESEAMMNGQNGRARTPNDHYVTRENGADVAISKGTRRVLYALKSIMGVLLFGLVLTCSMFSKLTLVSITDRLRTATWNISNEPTKAQFQADSDTAASLYWQLFFIMIVPNVIAFGRSFVFGVFGKTKKSFPWPKPIAVLLGLILSAVEVLAISVFVFLVLSYLPPDISLLLLNGVFLAQIGFDVLRTPCRPSSEIRNGYNDLELTTDSTSLLRSEKMKRFSGTIRMIFENRTVKLIALGVHFAGIAGLAIYVGLIMHAEEKVLGSVIAFPIVLIAMSFIWSDPVQRLMAKTKKKVDEFHSARYKSSLINSGFKLLLYPFVSYLVFRYFTPHHVDPWCLDLDDSCNLSIDWRGDLLATFLVQILTTLFAYIFVWIACTMTLHWCGLALPLILSTPASFAWYYISIAVKDDGRSFFPSYNPQDVFQGLYPVAPLIASALWLSEILAMGYYLWTHSNIILAKDTVMFLSPYYDGVFLEQQIMLNRQTTKGKNQARREYHGSPIRRPPRTIFICSTMFRENDIEMRQMLTSIYRVAHHFEKQQEANPNGEFDIFESHIFFDGAINGTQLTQFALQLISLLEETVKVRLQECQREKTPYGYRLTWYLGSNDRGMPFTVHMKDNLKVKNKKRWSQVMYMNYIIKYRIQNDELDPDNTFILTTDADIDFTSESAVVLLDMLASNEKVGAVSARTHPKGSGPVYWYQIFDYAIGHWFQKPAEHILGCVLCCPGCFSVFRCSALKEAMEEYSTDVTSALEFLTKDMGEDRWLCTLLIQRGWRLEYCAISEDYTYCPISFEEFYKQRRRWIPSTIANLALLISEAGSITRGNDTVSILFILFQALMVFSTAISPATVILVIASGLQSAYKMSDDVTIAIIAVLIVVSVIYGIICINTSQKTQLDIAKLMTFIFSVIMAIVVAGIFKDTVNSIFPYPKLTFLQAPNCSNFQSLNPLRPNGTISNGDAEAYENCVKAARYLGSLPNTVGNPGFKLPVSSSTIYLGAFAFAFLVAGILHLPEFSCLLHAIWYLLALPSGYLLLLIYSAANLNSQSWGTREGKSGSGGIRDILSKYFKVAWGKMLLCFASCCGDKKGKEENGNHEEQSPEVSESKKASPPPLSTPTVPVVHKSMDQETQDWLRDLECEHYIDNFEEHGYVSKHFISSMDRKDFEAIGIDKRGFKLRLEKAAKKLPSLPIETDIPRSVEEWLCRLELEEYTELFHAEGYKTEEDVENLKDLTSDELMAIGIRKRAHLQRLENALKRLFYPSPVELQIRRTKAIIENVPIMQLGGAHHGQAGYNEADFWDDLIHRKLKPVTVRFTQIDDIKDMLKSLRNSILAVLLLVNLMWIILLYTLQFAQLVDYGLEPRAFQTVFLLVYGIIIVIQFVALVCHRGVTLVHYLGRTQPTEIIGPVNEDPLVVSIPAVSHHTIRRQ